MSQSELPNTVSRRAMLGTVGKAAVSAVALQSMLQTTIFSDAGAAVPEVVRTPGMASINGLAGVDRVVVLPGKTYLRGWAGYGEPPRRGPRRPTPADSAAPPPPTGPAPTIAWSRVSGPGRVTFANPRALQTSATFTAPGVYLLRLRATTGESTADSTLTVKVEKAPPAQQLEVVQTRPYRIDSPLWDHRAKALLTNWIPHCITQLSRTDVQAGGIDNFIEAGKKLRGEAFGQHKGYVFANAYPLNLLEAMSIGLMVDAKGDAEIVASQALMRKTLDEWIPIVIAAQEPDGYLQTAFTLPRISNAGGDRGPGPFNRWERRADHEGYVAGYLLEAAIAHHAMTTQQDARLLNAARKLADCWCDNIGPAPKKAWYDGHQEMEQALVRFGRYINEIEGQGKGAKYIALGKFLLDNRYHSARNERERSDYDQSHLPVVEQYEAVGHAVRAAYTYSGMADVAMETHDPDYRSAVKSIWDNITHRKWYVTGGIGSGESSEGFGPDYALRQGAYCESCSSCGQMFFNWKLGLSYHDARFFDLLEETMFNALLGGLSMDGKTFYYPNPLDARTRRTSWHSVPCCVGNIPRTLLSMPTWMYAKGPNAIHVNLFVGSTITVEDVAGTDVEMVQRTNYPWDGKVAITVNPTAKTRFSMRVRVPNREVSELYSNTPAVSGLRSMKVNGVMVTPTIENGYASVTRPWAAGDTLEFEVPMQVQRVHAIDKVEATRGKVALRYGPLVYNIEKVDCGSVEKTLAADARLTTEWRADLLGGVMTIKGTFADGSPMLAIPHYARMNREPEPPPRPPVTPPVAPPAAAAAPGTPPPRPVPPPVASLVWITEQK